MLTKNDLTQIRGLFQEETEKVIQRELKPVKKKLNKVAKDLDTVIRNYDDRITKNERDIHTIKQHVGLVQ